MAAFLRKLLRGFIIVILAGAIVSCGGQPEDDLDPKAVIPPGMSISDVAGVEGSTLIFTVQVAYPKDVDITVDYTTSGSSAASGVDFTSTSGTLTIPPAATSANITVATTADILDENDEAFSVNLSNPVNAEITDSSAVGSIIDDDPLPSLFIDPFVLITEGQTATLTISISEVSGRDVNFSYATSNGTAVSGSDFQALSGSAVIPQGSLSTTLSFVSVDDLVPEAQESASVVLSGLSNVSAGLLTMAVTINDDDAGANPFA
ncbi:MAG: hypothetical protein KDD34_01865, partial [Bdellovibrionales bacterium]|nr:hypothetical protein [Bdellovibrionales bacterium]